MTVFEEYYPTPVVKDTEKVIHLVDFNDLLLIVYTKNQGIVVRSRDKFGLGEVSREDMRAKEIVEDGKAIVWPTLNIRIEAEELI